MRKALKPLSLSLSLFLTICLLASVALTGAATQALPNTHDTVSLNYLPPSAPNPPGYPSNIPSWARTYVTSLWRSGVIAHNRNLIFTNYFGNISRLRAAQIMDNIAFLMSARYGVPYGDLGNDFNDTTDPAVLRLRRIDVVRGIEANNVTINYFQPNRDASRQELVVLFSRIIGHFRYGNTNFNDNQTHASHNVLEQFADHCNDGGHERTRISTWARGAVSYLVHHTYMVGFPANRFNAHDEMTVSQKLTLASRSQTRMRGANSSVQISNLPLNNRVVVNSQHQLSANLPNNQINWVSSNSARLSVDSTGRLNAPASTSLVPTEVQITAQLRNNTTVHQRISVWVVPEPSTLRWENQTVFHYRQTRNQAVNFTGTIRSNYRLQRVTTFFRCLDDPNRHYRALDEPIAANIRERHFVRHVNFNSINLPAGRWEFVVVAADELYGENEWRWLTPRLPFTLRDEARVTWLNQPAITNITQGTRVRLSGTLESWQPMTHVSARIYNRNTNAYVRSASGNVNTMSLALLNSDFDTYVGFQHLPIGQYRFEMRATNPWQSNQLVRSVNFDVTANAARANCNVRNPVNFPNNVMIWPLAQRFNISSRFGPRGDGFHHGIDINQSAGQYIYAVADWVVASRRDGLPNRPPGNPDRTPGNAWGNNIHIRHANNASVHTTVYAHLYPGTLLVALGQQVQRGQRIARVGNSGYSTGFHLCFETWTGSNRTTSNPLNFFNDRT